MTTWRQDDLAAIGGADEVGIASTRPDGSVRPYVTIWAVRVGDDLYIRSAHGGDNPWYRRALASGTGRIRGGGIERDVSFEPAGAEQQQAIDAEYHRKYDRYGAKIVDSVVGEPVHALTLRLRPTD